MPNPIQITIAAPVREILTTVRTQNLNVSASRASQAIVQIAEAQTTAKVNLSASIGIAGPQGPRGERGSLMVGGYVAQDALPDPSAFNPNDYAFTQDGSIWEVITES